MTKKNDPTLPKNFRGIIHLNSLLLFDRFISLTVLLFLCDPRECTSVVDLFAVELVLNKNELCARNVLQNFLRMSTSMAGKRHRDDTMAVNFPDATAVSISAPGTSTMSDASELSVALFASMHALTCAEAQLHEKERRENETCIVSALVHAMRVAHASCEAALTRVEPMYDAVTCDAAEFALCNAAVASALENANVVVSALKYASTQSLLSVDVCVDASMRAAIDTENMCAVALGVVLLSEFDAIVPPRGLFLCALQRKNPAIDILQVLLSSPALQSFIDDRDVLQNTVLMIAARNGHTDAVGVLLKCPAVVASVFAVNGDGNTALMIASYCVHPNTVNALLACPAVVASVGVANIFGCTALMLASYYVYPETVQALLACPAVFEFAGAVNKLGGDTALMIASQNGHTKTVIALLACPAVIESAGVVDTNGDTALMLAVMREHVETVEALLGCPAVVATMGVANNGFTVLMIAEQTGHARMVQLLRACTVRS